ncbi:MAG: cyclopropane-fatty-acyl-phospholipid synthase [Clostridiales bacterium]|nr:cyclopropane-fatty-acyl-phospholipid synthase [Clostridiales bacterium]MDN5281286.1 cyclopropane-fatty-acyl-phospholipid synthase [Candidatus Ozemobacter sp.]
MSLTSKIVLKILETGLVPEKITRAWIKRLCQSACERASLGDIEARHSVYRQIVKDLKAGTQLKRKNILEEQLVEMDPEFYKLFLGKRLAEGCCFFPTGAEDLDEAEDTMLWMTADRARIRDGMKILELGCGWGAMAFWLARQYPEAHITAVTDSVTRGIYIQKKIHELDLNNVKMLTSDFEDLSFKDEFDRVVSVERLDFIAANPDWQKIVYGWLKDDGKLFLQSQVHADLAFYLDSVGLDNLPGNLVNNHRLTLSSDMPLLFQKSFHIEDFWKLSGENYKLTAERRLRRYYFNRLSILPHFEKAYGKRMAWIWFQRWRMSLLAISEQFGLNRGQSWIVGQYLYKKKN